MLRRVLIPALVVLALGCSSPSGGEVAAPAKIDPRVFVVDATPGVDVQVEPERLVFDALKHGDLILRQPGDILVSANGTGFMRTVVSVVPQDSTLVIATTAANMGDAIIDGTATQSSDMSGMNGKWDMDGKYDGVLPFDGMLQVGDTTVLANADVSVKLKEAHVGFKPSVTLDLDMKDRKLTWFKAVAEGDVEASMIVQVATMGNIAVRQDKELWHSTPKTFVQWIGFVPVVEVVQLSFGIGAEVAADGAATFEVGGKLNGNVTAGATYDRYNGGWHAVGDRSITIVPLSNVEEGEASVDVTVYLFAELDVKFYDLAGPFIYVAPYAAASHQFGAAGWKPSMGVMGAWGGKIEIFGETVAGFESQLFDYSKDL